ncbi:MAG TPA: hypothetical protein VGK19_10420 [Capsulimonadaceae bacterium]
MIQYLLGPVSSNVITQGRTAVYASIDAIDKIVKRAKVIDK